MEKLSVKGMIESILLDMSENRPIDTYVLKIQMVSKMLKNENLSHWIDKEINGYDKDDELPEHRTIKTRVIANLIIDNGIKGATISNHEMPLYTLGVEKATEIATIQIRDSIIALSKLALSSTEGEIVFTTTEYEKYWLNTIYENSNILSAHKPIAKTDIDIIIFKFNSILLDLFMELNDSIISDEINFDIMANRNEIDSIVNQTFNAGIVNMGDNTSLNTNNTQIIGGKNNTVTINNEAKAELNALLEQIKKLSESLAEEKDELLDEIKRIETQIGKSIPKVGVINSALQTINGILLGVAGNVSTPIVLDGIRRVLSMLG